MQKKITEDITRKTAELAKLTFDESEITKMTAELLPIVELADELPLFDEDCGRTENSNVLRSDIVFPSVKRDELLSNAAAKTDNYICVPKIAE